MSTYIAAPSAAANNANQKGAQATAGIVSHLVSPLVAALSTADNTANQKTAQPTSGQTRQIVPRVLHARAAPQPIAINVGGGQAGYAG